MIFFRILRAIDSGIDRASAFGLIVSVALMLVLSLTTIVLRWVGEAWLWIDPFTRHLVFLCAFLGGVLATGKGTHIGIDLVSRILEARGSEAALRWLRALIALASTVVCYFLFQAGLDLAKVELEMGRPSFLGIHTGVLVSIIPFGMSLIGFRFLVQTIMIFDREPG